MAEVICEQLSRHAGFKISVGNWISPNGDLINGENYDEQHLETLIKYTGETPGEDTNALKWMNLKVDEGFIRLVFRSDVLFQVGCSKKEDIWSERPNYRCMINVLTKLEDTETHIFSRTFYIIGKSQLIAKKELSRMEVQESTATGTKIS